MRPACTRKRQQDTGATKDLNVPSQLRSHAGEIFAWKTGSAIDSITRMFNLLLVLLTLFGSAPSNDLPTKKYLDLAAIKTMVAAAEAEAKKRNVEVTICIVDDSGNLLFLQKGDAAPINTIEFAQKKARHAALYKSPSKDAADAVKKGSVEALAFPNFFPNQGGLPIASDGRILGGIAASGAKSEIDEAIAQAAIDALFKK
jgi:glc operon protein GlcG